MGESKGKAWIGKIYNKLEKILVEVDTFTSQSTRCLKSRDLSGWDSVRSEPEDTSNSNMRNHHDRVASLRCERPFDPPLQQNFEILGNARVEEEDSLKESLLSVSSSPDGEMLSARTPLVEDYCRCNLTSATTRGAEERIINDEDTRITNPLSPRGRDPSVFPDVVSVEEVRVESCKEVVSVESQSTQTCVEFFGKLVDSECNGDPVLDSVGISTNDSNLNPIRTTILAVPVQDNVPNIRSSNEDKTDDVANAKPDVAPSDTNPLYSSAFREDPSYVDDNALYAVRLRTKKLRSFKRKVLDALNSKRTREKEYEHLAIWFGDADMGSDLVTGEDSKAIDSKRSQVLELEESQWELL